MKEFALGNHISLRLEEDQTVIYIDGERFNQCKYILISRKIDELEELLSLDSVDELTSGSSEYEYNSVRISPETEFWAHCSNLQIWHENEYDSRLLHSNLAFPLLKRLVVVGDKKAKKVFSEEVAKRFNSKYPPVVAFLIREEYYKFLPFEYILDIIADRELFNNVTSEGYEFDFNIYLNNLGESYSHIIKVKIIETIHQEKFENLIYMIEINLLDNLTKEDLTSLICDPDIDIIKVLFHELMKKNKYDHYYQDGFSFSPKVIQYVGLIISNRLVAIIRCSKDSQEFINIILLELLLFIDSSYLLPLLLDKELNLLKIILDIRFEENYDIFNFYFKFLKSFKEDISCPLKDYFESLLITGNYSSIKHFLEDGLLNKLNNDDLNSLLSSPDFDLIMTIIKITSELDSRESYLYAGTPFTKKILAYGCKSLKDTIMKIFGSGETHEIISIIRLRFIDCLNDNDLGSLALKCDILKFLTITKNEYFEEVKEWIEIYIKKIRGLKIDNNYNKLKYK